MDALAGQDYITSIDSAGDDHVRCEVTGKGRMVLGRPDIYLTDAMFAQSSAATTYDNRVGIQTETFTNQGAVQTGDHAVQQVTITNDQRSLVLQHLTRIRETLTDEDLEPGVVDAVTEAVDNFEDAVQNGDPDPSILRQLREQALGAAAAAVGTEAGGQLLQQLIALGSMLPLAG